LDSEISLLCVLSETDKAGKWIQRCQMLCDHFPGSFSFPGTEFLIS
jgi:hypothetical protein